MLITLSRRTAICQSVAEVYLTGVAPLGAVSHRFNFNLITGEAFTEPLGSISHAESWFVLFRHDVVHNYTPNLVQFHVRSSGS